MKTKGLPLLFAAALLTVALPLAPAAHAQPTGTHVAASRSTQNTRIATSTSGGVSADTGDVEADSWVGGFGAVLCGVGINVIRVNPAIGMNPYVLGATIGGCILVALDIAASKHSHQ